MRARLRDLDRHARTLPGWALFAAVSLLWVLLVVPPTLLLGRLRPGAYAAFRRLTRAALRLFVRSLPFLRLRVEGSERRVAGARVLVANHQSFLDPIVLLGLEPGLSGPVRSYMFRVPVMRTLLPLLGFFPSDVGEIAALERLHASARAAKARGEGLLFFPEGTRSRSGAVGPFHRGAFRLAYDHGLPVQPVVIEGLDRALPPGRVLSPQPGRQRVRLRYLPALHPPFGEGRRRDVVRALAARSREDVAGELARMRAEPREP